MGERRGIGAPPVAGFVLADRGAGHSGLEFQPRNRLVCLTCAAIHGFLDFLRRFRRWELRTSRDLNYEESRRPGLPSRGFLGSLF